MPPSQVFASWLAFYFLAFRGALLWATLLWTMELERTDSGIGYRISARDSALDVLMWSPLWALLALAIIAPWFRVWLVKMGWSGTSRYFDEDHASWMNIIGRWILLLSLLSAPFFDGDLVEFLFFRSAILSGPAFLCSVIVSLVLLPFLPLPEVTKIASSGFTGFIDAVFFPGGRESKPPFTLKLARYYVETHRWEEAEAEYARMLSFHPEQVKAWQERLTLAFRRLNTADPTPEEVLTMATKTLQAPADREALRQCFVRGAGS